ncbi:class I SAM-dependent methyltransferase [Leifsonia sp. 2MCAF36]|uniref:class I SAM-dependent methyltransferase n=1 Tax=Leifsonia sp. 2MCAF36 TaxID=3232988 RepID=UPI003F984807
MDNSLGAGEGPQEDRAELWKSYNDKQSTRRTVRPLLSEAAELAGPGDGRVALELGCGAGIESVELARRGWQVMSIDYAPETVERVGAVITELDPQTRPAIHVQKLDLESPETGFPFADLIYSGYTLPYLHPATFPRVWRRLMEAMRPGGYLAVQLFGDRDSYVGQTDWNFHSRADTLELLQGLEIISFTEEDEDGMAAGGPKHWHVFHIIARRPSPDGEAENPGRR